MGFVPHLTRRTAAAADASGFLDELYAYFNGGNSPNFELDPDVSGHSQDGFVIAPLDSSESWQLSLRDPGTGNILCLLESADSLTAAGDASTQPSGITNGVEGDVYTFDEQGPYDTQFTVIETADLFSVVHPDDANAVTPVVCQFGRVYDPFFPNFTGLGMVGSEPIPANIGGDLDARWQNQSRLEFTPGEWTSSGDNVSGFKDGNPNIQTGGYESKTIPIPFVAASSSPNWGGTALGKWRYIHFKPTYSSNDFSAGTLFKETNDETTFALVGSNGNGQDDNYCIIWDGSVTPNF